MKHTVKALLETHVMGRILVFDESVAFKETLLQIIESRYPTVVIKSVQSREECLTKIKSFFPDILFLGFNLFSGAEYALLDQICKSSPGVNVILFTDYDINEYRKDAIMKGVSHVISKESWTSSEILALIKTIFRTREAQIQ